MTQDRQDRRGYDVNRPMTGSRLVELAVAVVLSSVISASLASVVTVSVLSEQVAHLKSSQEEIKQELREFRRDIYRPAWPEREMELDWQDFLDDLKNSLHSAGQRFAGTDTDPDDDFRRFALAASADLAERRGRTLIGEITLVADQASYAAPADLIYVKTSLWGSEKRIDPWDDRYPGRLPRALAFREDDSPVIRLQPSPTQHQINVLGSTYQFFYAAGYWSGNPADAIKLDRQDDRELLLLRAQAEAMRELTMQRVASPGETKIKLAQASNMTTRALFDALMDEFNRRTGAGVAA